MASIGNARSHGNGRVKTWRPPIQPGRSSSRAAAPRPAGRPIAGKAADPPMSRGTAGQRRHRRTGWLHGGWLAARLQVASHPARGPEGSQESTGKKRAFGARARYIGEPCPSAPEMRSFSK